MNNLFSIWIKGSDWPVYTGDSGQTMMFSIDLIDGYPHGHPVAVEDIQVLEAGQIPSWN